MKSTYRSGWSRSARAEAAEEEGRFPWTRLPAKDRYTLSKTEAMALRLDTEWHHTSKFANVTHYFSPECNAFALKGQDLRQVKKAARLMAACHGYAHTPEEHEAKKLVLSIQLLATQWMEENL